MKATKPTVQITFAPESGWDDRTFDQRLRRFLKVALRSFGLRCREIRDVPPPDAPRYAPGHADGSGGIGEGK
ncbi:MAG: hypothetical protein JNM56_16465 [Planctomycetia bacterium]|nr:hypothetical protein [Planctomycetia bacterium]